MTAPDFTPNQKIISRHQRLLLEALHQGPLTTLAGREKLGIQGVAPRMLELRRAGWPIITRRRRVLDEHGRPHVVAEYVLASTAKREGGAHA